MASLMTEGMIISLEINKMGYRGPKSILNKWVVKEQRADGSSVFNNVVRFVLCSQENWF